MEDGERLPSDKDSSSVLVPLGAVGMKDRRGLAAATTCWGVDVEARAPPWPCGCRLAMELWRVGKGKEGVGVSGGGGGNGAGGGAAVRT